jgi:lysophospholipase L1-like esterase
MNKILFCDCKNMAVVPLLAFFILTIPLLGQQLVPTPGIPPTGFPGLDEYRASRIAMYTDDFGQMGRYRQEDAALGPPAAGAKRVIFFGDSITEGWKLGQYFSGKPYVNRGISGQTTPQMLLRFRQDVVSLHPKVVVILAGTNDLAGTTGPLSNEDIEANYASMADLARANGIGVVFSSVLPVHNYSQHGEDYFAQRPMERILALDSWLKDYCIRHRIVYLDYFSAMVDDKGMLMRDLSDDGLHPNAAGYKIMAPMAEKAIAKALATTR